MGGSGLPLTRLCSTQRNTRTTTRLFTTKLSILISTSLQETILFFPFSKTKQCGIILLFRISKTKVLGMKQLQFRSTSRVFKKDRQQRWSFSFKTASTLGLYTSQDWIILQLLRLIWLHGQITITQSPIQSALHKTTLCVWILAMKTKWIIGHLQLGWLLVKTLLSNISLRLNSSPQD